MTPLVTILDALLDSWDRNNRIMIGLLRTLPEGGLAVRAMDGSPTVAQQLMHLHYIRLVHVFEDVPELSTYVPEQEWPMETDADLIAQLLNESATAVRDAARSRLASGQPMNVHYDHPILFLQHMIWHEGYHHGQIKLALKLAGRAIPDDDIGVASWGVWMDKTPSA